MIDIEVELFDNLATAIKGQYGNSFNVVSERQNVPNQFPCVSIVQEDSYTDTATIDSGSNENCVNIMVEINVYSNSKIKKKSECKQIAAFVNDKLITLGFARTMLNPIPNADNSIYRIVGRYVAKVDKQQVIYGR